MTIENLRNGLEILTRHGATGHCLAAEHDKIWVASATDVKMPLTAIRRLRKLGFYIDKEMESWYLYP